MVACILALTMKVCHKLAIIVVSKVVRHLLIQRGSSFQEISFAELAVFPFGRNDVLDLYHTLIGISKKPSTA